jgi:flavorubredoxin
MYTSINITEDIFWLGVNDRKTHLFENLWPLDNGVSYNSYLVVDEKIALIDTVERSKTDEFLGRIHEIIGDRKIDYLVINHMEPDHSGGIKEILKENPDIKIVGNKMTFVLLRGLYNIDTNHYLIGDGDSINLGKHELKFIITPWLHWPETMMTYDIKDQVLFTGDAFGSFGTLNGGIFDDELNMDFYIDEMRRYYSNIVAKYSKMVVKAMDKISGIPLKFIASTHGPIWRSHIDWVLRLYRNWATYKAEKGVVIVFGSMYGNTEQMADIIARRLSEKGIRDIKIYDSSRRHLSYILSEIWHYKGLLLGSSAYNGGIFPPIENITRKLEEIEVSDRLLGTFGSSGWNKAGVKGLNQWAESMKWDLIATSPETRGAPEKNSIEMCIELADEMAARLHELYPDNK